MPIPTVQFELPPVHVVDGVDIDGVAVAERGAGGQGKGQRARQVQVH